MSSTERGVAAELASGTDPAQWVSNHGDALFRYALVRVRDRNAAEELVQETLVAGLANRRSFSGQAQERTWLVGILKHKVCDFYRRRRRETTDDQTDTVVEGLFSADGHWKKAPENWTIDAPALMERAEFWEAFEECVGGLPERVAAAFMMRVLDETPAEEVCQALSISATNLWTLMHRARLRLRRCLEMKWFAPGKEGDR